MTDSLISFLHIAADLPPAPQEPGMAQFLVIMAGGLVIMIVIQTLFGRKDSKERQQLEQRIAGLKKNDPVVTIGGILGQVVSVSEDKKEVTVRVDDNTRIKFQAAAIRPYVNTPAKDKEKSSS